MKFYLIADLGTKAKIQNRIDVVKNRKRMYKNGDGTCGLLAASIRHLEHLLASLK